MSDKKRFNKPGSLQPNIEDILQWNDLPADAFDPATSEEKENFIQDRRSVSYWKDAWRRLKKNTVAMIALGVIIFLFLFAFVGPLLVPYGYDQFSTGAENLYPYHYALEDQTRLDEEIAARLKERDIVFDRLRHYRELATDPQAVANGFMKEHVYENGHPFMMAMPPVHMRNMAPTGTGRGPQPGEHTDEILKQYGYSEDEIAHLKEAGAVKQHS